jgi:tRNA-specific 2-thiouridylase
MKNVYVGMSGGVDSSVSAALLQEQGFAVTGVYMKNWTQDVAGVACPWKQDLADARAVAAVLDIPFKIFDFQSEYKHLVVDAMVAEYAAGRTPNPDIMCNQEIKFKLFLEAALADGADMIATGHYARTSDGQLLRASDDNKDQTYFLYRVTSEALRHTIFPLGDLAKPQVRELAAKFELPTAKKPDSQGICFVGEVGIRSFLSQYVTAEAGPVLDRATGRQLGTHAGAVFYTTGQRQGLGIGGGTPYYVTGKDMDSNTVFVTGNPADLSLATEEFVMGQSHWIGEPPTSGKTYRIRMRHRGALIDCEVSDEAGDWSVKLSQEVRAVTAGQSAVIYDGEVVVGGGIINL